ncbi:MAG: hypothetical protein KIT14_08450 [bacterium]|nr:hypothetical protein [bacterium]
MTAGRRTWLATGLVALVGLVQRAWLLVAFRAEGQALQTANPEVYMAHHAPLELLRDHLGVVLLLLQQTPPVSNLIFGLLVKAFSWPHGVTQALLVLQGATSVAAAVLLHRLLLGLFPGRLVVVTLAALYFVLDVDLIVLEYNAFGQTFYENLGMLLVLGLAATLMRLGRTGAPRAAALAGLCTGLLALTRATWSFFWLPGLALVAWLARGRRARAAGAFLLPVLLLQGAWCAKNTWVYGRFTMTTSSWTGFNLMNGLRGAGYAEPFGRWVLDHGDPPWMAEALAPGGVARLGDILPAEYRERDAALAARWGVENWGFNTAVAGAFFAAFERSFTPFALRHPDVVLIKTARAYALFWQPIANFGRMYISLFCTPARTTSGLDVPGVLRQWASGTLPEPVLLTSGRQVRRRFAPVAIGSPTWLDPARFLATVVGVHVLAPLAVVLLVRRRRHGGSPTPREAARATALVVCGALYVYLAVFSSLGEYGENMRFRLGVEPLIWLLTALGAAECLAALRRRSAR